LQEVKVFNKSKGFEKNACDKNRAVPNLRVGNPNGDPTGGGICTRKKKTGTANRGGGESHIGYPDGGELESELDGTAANDAGTPQGATT